MKIKIVDKRITTDMLGYKTKGSAGIDLYALPNEYYANSLVWHGIYTEFSTGIKLEIPEGHVGIIVPRSSSGSNGLMLANTVGVIDSDYRGEIKLRLVKWKVEPSKPIEIKEPVRVAQLLIMPVKQVDIEIVDSLEETDRGENGFGSTGKE